MFFAAFWTEFGKGITLELLNHTVACYKKAPVDSLVFGLFTLHSVMSDQSLRRAGPYFILQLQTLRSLCKTRVCSGIFTTRSRGRDGALWNLSVNGVMRFPFFCP